MINHDRIVPIVKVDLLTLIGTILALIGTTYTVVKASTVEGAYSVTGTGDVGNKLADQPVQTLDFATGVTAGVVYFVPAYDYAGITVAGAAPTYAEGSATVKADGKTLYKAALSSGTVTVTAVSPVVAE